MRRLALLTAALASTVSLAAQAGAAPQGGPSIALVTAETENALLAVSLPDGQLLRRFSLPADPENVAVDGRTAAVVSAHGHAVSIFRSHPLQLLGIVRGFGNPHLAAFSRNGRLLYVTDDGRGELVTIDLRTRHVVDRLTVGAEAHHLSVSPTAPRLWLALGEDARTIVIVDTSRPSRPRVLRRFHPNGSVHDLSFSPDGSRVWLTSSTSPAVAVVDAHSGRRLFSVPAGKAPQHVTFDYRGRAVVTSGYSRRIELVSPRGRVLQTARVPYGSFNVTTAGSLVVTSSLMRGTLTELDENLHLIHQQKVAPAARCVALVVW